MRVCPYFACKYVTTDAERIQFECSDQFFIPKTLLDTLKLTTDVPAFLTLRNTLRQTITGTVRNMYDDDGVNDTIYVPTWMFMTLSDPSGITISACERHPCTKIKFRPHTSDFTSIPDWDAKLAKALRNYGSLTQNTTIPIQIDGAIVHMTVDALAPMKYKTCVMLNDSCVDIEFVQPTPVAGDDDTDTDTDTDAAAADPMKTCQYLVFPGRNRKKKKVKKYVFTPFMCTGYTCAPSAQVDTNRTPQSMSHEAALRRIAADATRGIPAAIEKIETPADA